MVQRRAGSGLEPAERPSEPAGRALEPVERASGQVGRVLGPAGRVSEQAGRAVEPAGRGLEPAWRPGASWQGQLRGPAEGPLGGRGIKEKEKKNSVPGMR